MAIRQETIKIGSKEYNKIYSSEDKELSSLTNGAVYRAFYSVSSFNEDEFVEIDNGGSVGPSVLVDTYISNVAQTLFALLVNNDQIKENTVYLISSDNFSMYGNKITNLKDPIDISDAVNLNTLNVKYNELLNLISKLCADISNILAPTPPTPEPEEPEPEEPEPSIDDTILTYRDGTTEIKKISGEVTWSNLGIKETYESKNNTLILVKLGKSVNSIGLYTFRGCYLLKSINIPNSVSSIGVAAFHSCETLTSVNIPSSVTSIGEWAFWYCLSLPSVNIPNSVSSIEDLTFYYCSSLTSVNIPNSVTSIGYAAILRCKSLKSITIPSSVISIGNYAFYWCDSLTSIVFEGKTMSLIGSIKDYPWGADSSAIVPGIR